MHYNFCRIHQTLRRTPAMAAGVATQLWNLEDMIEVIDSQPRGDQIREIRRALVVGPL
jgi:hypothetical protein